MDQGLKVGELTANKPADDDDEMDNGVNLNDCFETDVTIKSISNDSDNIKVQGLKVGDKGDVNDHDVDYVLDDEVWYGKNQGRGSKGTLGMVWKIGFLVC
ncbi:hypothetical protein L1987_48484 [Smallanthus sonchifolius]|uniref:Uncharacterized protein n=1 Tax=Smallanthus sonchifolius TaxID=185202 RepID=A0ACB9FSZ5_9ASTR|nr:hypothetical protein L1987_48484 [Smallanthus sonchifolius]